jgi:hypothetical protein
VFGIGADRPDSDELAHAVLPGFVHELDAHYQVVVEEFCRAGAVRSNTADQGCQVEDDVGTGILEHAQNFGMFNQIIVFDVRDEDVFRSMLIQFFDHPSAQEACSSSNANAPIFPEID